MKFSYNWLKELVEFKESPEELANLINLHITEVETVESSAGGYNGVIVAEILEIKNHPNADKLHLVTLDIGLGRKATVVCGANNIEIGQKVPLAMVGAKLPGGEMKAAVIRGVESAGMICSGAELGFEKKSEGILVLDKKASVGRPVQEFLEVPRDTVIDLKVLSNRPDYLSYIGIAREISAVLGKSLSDKIIQYSYQEDPTIKTVDKVSVEVADPDVCTKYLARYMANVEVKESPDWLQEKLTSSGIRPINNIVDISNFVMLELGQPVHAFDVDKILNNKRSFDSAQDDKRVIIVRRAKSGEKIEALDGKVYELNPEIVVIANGNEPIAMAGLMGSESSGVTDLTTEIIIEVATFDPIAVRRGSKSIGLATDASMRFERALQPPLADLAMERVLDLITQVMPMAKIAQGNVEYAAQFTPPKAITCSVKKINDLLGSRIPAKDISQIMERLAFTVKPTGKDLLITPPVWRSDIKELADITEEVVRIWGIDKIVPVLPVAQMTAPVVNQKLTIINRLKDILARCKFAEAPSHPFIGSEWVNKLGLKLDNRLKIANPLNQQWTYLTASLWPNLVGFASKYPVKTLKLFDIATTFMPGKDILPIETSTLAMVVISQDDAYRELRGVLELLTNNVDKLKFVSLPVNQDENYINSLRIMSDRDVIGMITEISPKLATAIDLPIGTVFAELDIDKLTRYIQRSIKYQEISRFPSSQFDVSVELDPKVSAGTMIDEIKLSSILIKSIDVVDIYELPSGGRSITLRIVLQSDERTLTDIEIKTTEGKVNNIITTKYRGHIR